MREVGLALADEMVRAILTGQKWQTRRPLDTIPPRPEAGINHLGSESTSGIRNEWR